MKHNTESYEDSMQLLSDPAGLRVRAEADGYLFFRGLLPKEPLLELRRQIIAILDRHGFMDKCAFPAISATSH